MTQNDYEFLRNKGFRVYKIDKEKIWIKNRKGWSLVCEYSEARWNEIKAHEKTIIDY